MAHLPPPILEEIFCRIPSVKDLLKFRSVCKSWKTVIDDSDFKKMHFEALSSSKSSNDVSTILLWYKIARMQPPYYNLIRILDECQFLDFSHQQEPPMINNFSSEIILVRPEDECPEGYIRHRLYVRFGAVKGILCVGLDFDDFCIWNPSIKKELKSFKAPPVRNHLFRALFTRIYALLKFIHTAEIFAFGYDPVSRDYKFLIAIFAPKHVLPSPKKIINTPPIQPYNFNNITRVCYWIYSLRNDSWKYDVVENFPLTNHLVLGDGYTDDGKFYWFSKKCSATSAPALIVFDFCTEAFDWMPLPQQFANVDEAIAVENCGGLELLTTFVVNGSNYLEDEWRFEVWRMQNNSNDGSSPWSKKYECYLGNTTVRKPVPIGLLNGGEIIFQLLPLSFLGEPSSNRALFLINPHTLAYIYLGLAMKDVKVFKFVKSLFSLNDL